MRCAVFGCNSDNQTKNFDGVTKFFSFPRDHQLKKAWIDACYRKDSFNTVTSRICSKHFSVDQFERNLRYELLNYMPKNAPKLKSGAVPLLNLPKSKERSTKKSSRKCAKEFLQSTKDPQTPICSSAVKYSVMEETVAHPSRLDGNISSMVGSTQRSVGYELFRTVGSTLKK